MRELELILALLAVSGAVQVLARRISVPYPSLLVVGGLALAFVPGLPSIVRDPELLFMIFVPPLLYWTAITTSYIDLRKVFGSVTRLATLLVLLTMCAVAVVIHALAPQFTWAAAFLLGTIVAPPDPVAASAVIRPLGVSREVTTLLEGEGLFNDAVALVLYRVALTAGITGTFSLAHASLNLAIVGVAGAAIGLAAGWLIAFVRRHIIGRLPIVENTLSLLAPFIAYIAADSVGTSGVIAVVTLGLYLGRQDPRIMSPASRIQAEAMWTMMTFLLESLIFIIVGLELRDVVHGIHVQTIPHLVALAGIVTLVCVAARFAWVFASVAILRASRARRHKRRTPNWHVAGLVSWAGMRGGDSLIIALAIPFTTAAGTPFPARDPIIFITFGVILATLVVQGMTLSPLVRRLDVSDDEDEAWRQEAIARVARSEAALAALDEIPAGTIPKRVAARLRDRYEIRLERWRTIRDSKDSSATRVQRARYDEQQATSEKYENASARLLEAERNALMRLRDRETTSDEVLRRQQRELDLEEMLLASTNADQDETAPGSPFEIEGLE